MKRLFAVPALVLLVIAPMSSTSTPLSAARASAVPQVESTGGTPSTVPSAAARQDGSAPRSSAARQPSSSAAAAGAGSPGGAPGAVDDQLLGASPPAASTDREVRRDRQEAVDGGTPVARTPGPRALAGSASSSAAGGTTATRSGRTVVAARPGPLLPPVDLLRCGPVDAVAGDEIGEVVNDGAEPIEVAFTVLASTGDWLTVESTEPLTPDAPALVTFDPGRTAVHLNGAAGSTARVVVRAVRHGGTVVDGPTAVSLRGRGDVVVLDWTAPDSAYGSVLRLDGATGSVAAVTGLNGYNRLGIVAAGTDGPGPVQGLPHALSKPVRREQVALWSPAEAGDRPVDVDLTVLAADVEDVPTGGASRVQRPAGDAFFVRLGGSSDQGAFGLSWTPLVQTSGRLAPNAPALGSDPASGTPGTVHLGSEEHLVPVAAFAGSGAYGVPAPVDVTLQVEKIRLLQDPPRKAMGLLDVDRPGLVFQVAPVVVANAYPYVVDTGSGSTVPVTVCGGDPGYLDCAATSPAGTYTAGDQGWASGTPLYLVPLRGPTAPGAHETVAWRPVYIQTAFQESDTVSGPPGTPLHVSLVVHPFDATQGHELGVRCDLLGHIDALRSVENTADRPAEGLELSASTSFTADFPTPTSVEVAAFRNALELDAFDGKLDFAGTSGHFFGTTGDRWSVLAQPRDAFTSDRTVSASGTAASATFRATAGTLVQDVDRTTTSLKVECVYDYSASFPA